MEVDVVVRFSVRFSMEVDVVVRFSMEVDVVVRFSEISGIIPKPADGIFVFNTVFFFMLVM
jgi:hypothetical protein